MTTSISPSGILKKYIKQYHIVEIDSNMEYLPAERVFPYGHITLLFHYGRPSKFKKINEDEYVEPGFVVCGQQSTFYDLTLSGKTGMVFVAFKPHGAKPFFNIPVSEFQNENLAVKELIKQEAGDLEDKLTNLENNSQRIRCLENFLMGKLMDNNDFARMEHVVKLIESTNGNIQVNRLAQEACLGMKQFERVFAKNVGLNPKKFLGIVRFQNMVRMKRRSNNINLYELAFGSGYHDQSHFIHDFKSITGKTPGAFFKDII